MISASAEVHSAWAVVQNLSEPRLLEDKVTEPDDPDSAPATQETQEETALPTVCPSCAAAEFRGAARAEMAVDHNILVSGAISEDDDRPGVKVVISRAMFSPPRMSKVAIDVTAFSSSMGEW